MLDLSSERDELESLGNEKVETLEQQLETLPDEHIFLVDVPKPSWHPQRQAAFDELRRQQQMALSCHQSRRHCVAAEIDAAVLAARIARDGPTKWRTAVRSQRPGARPACLCVVRSWLSPSQS
ncbi:hypothetical protein PI125_g17106 [Phytophthora idaei]|nr:hypothetical protein PI125_g17106 [Phytophthora idaei]